MSTLGGTYISIASPQPGTTNTPFPAGPVPPFVPVVTTIESDHAILIANQSALLLAALVKIHGCLNEVNKALREMNGYHTAIPKDLKALEPMLLSVTAAIAPKTVVVAATASNQVKTNNFNVAVKKQAGDDPEMPSIAVQIRQGIVDSNQMNASLAASTAVTEYTTTAANTIVTYLTGTETYRTLLKYLDGAKDYIVGIVLPPTATDTKSAATGAAGVPNASPK